MGMIMMSIFGFVGFIIAIVLPIIFIRKEREANGGAITFGEAFKMSFLGLVIGGAIGTIFQILYVQVIDPEYAERLTAKTLEMSNNFMEGNMDDEMREEILRESESSTMDSFTLVGQLKSFVYGVIFYAVISLILAAILKRQPEGGAADTLDG
jgi:hypothetical protein